MCPGSRLSLPGVNKSRLVSTILGTCRGSSLTRPGRIRLSRAGASGTGKPGQGRQTSRRTDHACEAWLESRQPQASRHSICVLLRSPSPEVYRSQLWNSSVMTPCTRTEPRIWHPTVKGMEVQKSPCCLRQPALWDPKALNRHT